VELLGGEMRVGLRRRRSRKHIGKVEDLDLLVDSRGRKAFAIAIKLDTAHDAVLLENVLVSQCGLDAGVRRQGMSSRIQFISVPSQHESPVQRT